MGDITATGLIAGALSLTAALAWNEAAQTGVHHIVPAGSGKTFAGKLTYAILVTIIILAVFSGVKRVADASEKAMAEDKTKRHRVRDEDPRWEKEHPSFCRNCGKEDHRSAVS